MSDGLSCKCGLCRWPTGNCTLSSAQIVHNCTLKMPRSYDEIKGPMFKKHSTLPVIANGNTIELKTHEYRISTVKFLTCVWHWSIDCPWYWYWGVEKAWYWDVLRMTTVVSSPACITALHNVTFTTSAPNIIHPDRSAAWSILVVDVLTVVSDRTHSFFTNSLSSFQSLTHSFIHTKLRSSEGESCEYLFNKKAKIMKMLGNSLFQTRPHTKQLEKEVHVVRH